VAAGRTRATYIYTALISLPRQSVGGHGAKEAGCGLATRAGAGHAGAENGNSMSGAASLLLQAGRWGAGQAAGIASSWADLLWPLHQTTGTMFYIFCRRTACSAGDARPPWRDAQARTTAETRRGRPGRRGRRRTAGGVARNSGGRTVGGAVTAGAGGRSIRQAGGRRATRKQTRLGGADETSLYLRAGAHTAINQRPRRAGGLYYRQAAWRRAARQRGDRRQQGRAEKYEMAAAARGAKKAS